MPSKSPSAVSFAPAIGKFKTVVSWLFSFEVFFGLFLFVAVFKESPRLSWVPIDLTVIGFLGSLISGIWILAQRGFRVPRSSILPLVSIIMFCAWATVSLAWSPSREYGASKAAFLVIFGFWSYFGGLVFIGRDNIRIRRFCSVIVLMSLWLLVEIAFLIFSGEILRDLEWGNQYLSQGRLLGLGVLSILGIFSWAKISNIRSMGLTIVFITLLIALLVLGGRGPLVATLAAMSVALYCGIRLNSKGVFVRKSIVIFLLVVMCVAVWFFISGNLKFGTTTLDRFGMLMSVGGEGSTNTRLWYYGHALGHFQEQPIMGHGIGSFGILLGRGDVKLYPHNIFLEIMVELGVVGLALFAVFLVLSMFRLNWRLLKSDPYVAYVLMLLANSFINSMVSSDMSGNRLFYVALGLVAGITQGRKSL